MGLRGTQKNQTVKKSFTIVAYLNIAGDEYEVMRHRVEAESVKEAVEMVNSMISKR